MKLIEDLLKNLELKGDYVFWIGDNDSNLYDTFRDDIHGTDFLPDDFRFKTIYHLLDLFNQYEYIEDIENNLHETTESLVDVYNSELLKWVSSNLKRISYVDEYIQDYEPSDLVQSLMGGQYNEIYELANNILTVLKENKE
jgi:hypothetical protein